MARILPHRLVLPDLQNLHSLHSGVLESVSRFLVLRWLGYVLESNNVVARFYVCNALANGLDNASTLVPENDGESTLGVLAGECVGICVADTGVVDLNADLMGPRGKNLDILDGKVLAGFPGDCGLFQSVHLSEFPADLISSLRALPLRNACMLCGSAKRQALDVVTDDKQKSSMRAAITELENKKLQNVPCR